jgi:hypothetical protein
MMEAIRSSESSVRIVLGLLVTANVSPSSPISVALMMEPIRSSESSVITRVTRDKILEGGILQEPALFFSSSSSIILTRLRGPRSRSIASQEIL